MDLWLWSPPHPRWQWGKEAISVTETWFTLAHFFDFLCCRCHHNYNLYYCKMSLQWKLGFKTLAICFILINCLLFIFFQIAKFTNGRNWKGNVSQNRTHPPNPPGSGISFTLCFLLRFCGLSLLVSPVSQVTKIIIRMNAWWGIYCSGGSGVQLFKRKFFIVSVEEKAPKCRMKIVPQRRE